MIEWLSRSLRSIGIAPEFVYLLFGIVLLVWNYRDYKKNWNNMATYQKVHTIVGFIVLPIAIVLAVLFLLGW